MTLAPNSTATGRKVSMKLPFILATTLFVSNVLNASGQEIELVTIFSVAKDGEIKRVPSDHDCNGFYKVDRSMNVPKHSDGIIDWNSTIQTPSYGKRIKVYELTDQRSWLFSVDYQRSTQKEAVVGYGLFCVSL